MGARDGTFRGGRRPRAGERPAPLVDKIAKGEEAMVMNFPAADLTPVELDNMEELDGVDMPKPGEYLSARQRDGGFLGADEIYKKTWLWLKDRGCERLINPQMIESYALAFARFIQCDKAISQYGVLGKHPTTGAAMVSPFVQMSHTYQKQAQLLWYDIYDIVKQNCTTPFEGLPTVDGMERLIRTRK